VAPPPKKKVTKNVEPKGGGENESLKPTGKKGRIAGQLERQAPRWIACLAADAADLCKQDKKDRNRREKTVGELMFLKSQ